MATCPTCRTRYPDDVKTCSSDGEPLLPDEAFSGAAADVDLAVGQTVGEYRVEGKLGEGGFGAVYRAVHPLIGKTAAVKVLHKQYSSNPQMVSRFIAEARAVNQIRNRNIIDIFSFGALEDGRQYYVMELLDGSTMDAYLKKRGPLSPEEALPILRGIGRALDAAHAAGIAHRDLKPENIFLVFDDDGTVFPKLLDFGIAKLMGESGLGHKTRTGTPMGTPYYMSPEQCRGRNVDHRTDIYSFGIVVFETLAGKLPFTGEDVMEILMKHTGAPAPRLSEVNPKLPMALDAPVAAFLEKDPEKRPASISAGLDALAQAAVGSGFDVKISGRKPGEASGPQAAVRVGNATPADMGPMAEARTMLQEEGGKTVLSAETAPDKPAGSRAVVYGAAGVAAMLAVVGAGWMMRPKPPAPGAPPPPLTVLVAPSAPPTAPPAAPTVTPSVTAATESAPTEIELTIDATPKDVEVFQGATKIGTSAAPIKLKRENGTVKLTFKAKGYAQQDKDVSAASSGPVTVKLVKLGGAVKGRGDLEF